MQTINFLELIELRSQRVKVRKVPLVVIASLFDFLKLALDLTKLLVPVR
jgi:hypothetical protein